MEGVSNKIKITRRNNLIDYFSPYKLIVNDKEYIISSGETKYIELRNGMNLVTVKFLYFKKQIEIHSNSGKNLLIRTFLNRNWLLFFITIFIIFFLIMTYSDFNFGVLNSIVSYLGIGFFSILIFHCSIGYNNYLSIDFINK